MRLPLGAAVTWLLVTLCGSDRYSAAPVKIEAKNAADCETGFGLADESSLVQSWKHTDKGRENQKPPSFWATRPALSVAVLWWLPGLVWLGLLASLGLLHWYSVATATPDNDKSCRAEALLESKTGPTGPGVWTGRVKPHLEETATREALGLDVADLKERWQLEVKRRGLHASLGKAILQHCLLRSFTANLYGTCLAILGFAANFLLSVALGQLLSYVGDGRSATEKHGYMILVACALLPASIGLFEAESCTRNAQHAARSGAALFGLLGTKMKRLTATKAGQDALSLLGGVDGALRLTEQVGEAVPCLWRASIAFVQAGVVLAWLWLQLGWLAFLAPLGFAPLLPVSAVRLQGLVDMYVAYETSAKHRRQCLSDSQSKCGLPQVPQEFHETFLERAQRLRREELGCLWVVHNVSYQVALLAARWPQLVALSCVMVISAAGPKKPEVLLPLFLQLHCLLRQLSVCSGSVAKLWAVTPALARLEAFLHRRDVVPPSQDPQEGLVLEVSGSFAWAEDDDTDGLPILVDLDLKVSRGSHIAVLGTSGAGKTSLLNAAAGALHPLGDAHVRRTSSTLLLPSKPWIFPGSLQDNIVCGRSLEPERYEEVVQVLGLGDLLDTDLDCSSPSVRARVALARAAYGREELVLMDDPLLGLAYEEAGKVSREVLQGTFFAGRACVVTFGHATAWLVHFLEGFSSTLVLEGGVAVAQSEVPDPKADASQAEWALLETLRLPPQGRGPVHRSRPAAGTADDEQPSHKLSGAFGALAFLKLAGRCRMLLVYTLVLVDQVLQTGVDWFLLVVALRASRTGKLLGCRWQAAVCFINLVLKVALARAAASCCTAAGEVFHSRWLERCTSASAFDKVMLDLKLVDLGLSHQVWVVLTMLCSTIGILCLVHVRVPHPMLALLLAFPAYVAACRCVWQSFHSRMQLHRHLLTCRSVISERLHGSFESGAAAVHLGKGDHVADVEDSMLQAYADRIAARSLPTAKLLMQLSLCFSAPYTLAALMSISGGDDVMEVGLTLVPLALLMQFLVPCVDSLSGFEDVGAAAGGLVRLVQDPDQEDIKDPIASY